MSGEMLDRSTAQPGVAPAGGEAGRPHVSRPTLSPSAIGTEILDDPDADSAVVARMLREIARLNRWFGGCAAVRRGMEWLFDGDSPNTVSLLDIGTGAGDVPLDVVRWGRRRSTTVRAFGVERIRAAGELARDAGVPVMMACAGALPVRDHSVDIVIASQLAHHLSDDSVVKLMADATRLARRGVIIADLHPSRAAETALRVGGPLIGLGSSTIDDGVTSLRRGFTVARMRALCERAGIAAHIERAWGSRVVAVWRPETRGQRPEPDRDRVINAGRVQNPGDRGHIGSLPLASGLGPQA